MSERLIRKLGLVVVLTFFAMPIFLQSSIAKKNPPGVECWDLNGDGICQVEEDKDKDNTCSVYDCKEESQGIHCWDLNANFACDRTTEDLNNDNLCDVQDCQGAPGIDCWDLNGDSICQTGNEDKDGDGECSAVDCQGPEGVCDCPSSEELLARIDYIESHYRFTDMNNGTIKDNKTGLIWLKDANCFGEQNWFLAKEEVNNLENEQCGLTDGSSKGDWELPNKEEWEEFVNKEFKDPALANRSGWKKWSEGDPFTGVKTDKYWSQTKLSLLGDPYYVDLLYGKMWNDMEESNYLYVWPVKRR